MSTWTITIPDEHDASIVPLIYTTFVPEEQWGEMFKVVFTDRDVIRDVKVTTFSDPNNGVIIKRVED